MLSAEQFFDPTTVVFGKLILAMLLGAVIGTERAIIARQAAGMRTFGVVALGSCLFIIVANLVSFPYIGIMNFDPLRTAAAEALTPRWTRAAPPLSPCHAIRGDCGTNRGR